MKQDVVRYIKDVCTKFGFSAHYIPKNDLYMIHRNGRAVQNFTSKQFYEIPKLARMRMFNPLVKLGLNNNVDGHTSNQVFINKKLGKKII